MTEALSPGITELPNMTQGRRSLVGSVLSKGLIPAEVQGIYGNFLASEDRELCDEVYGNLLMPQSSHREIIYMLYPESRSVFWVLAERDDDPKQNLTVNLASKRAASSFLVISPCDQLRKNLSTYDNSYEGWSSYESPVVSVHERVPPNYFSHLVFPQEVWNDIKDLPIATGAEIIVVDDKVRRPVGGFVMADAPNYESILMTLANRIIVPHWVHAVRLHAENGEAGVAA